MGGDGRARSDGRVGHLVRSACPVRGSHGRSRRLERGRGAVDGSGRDNAGPGCGGLAVRERRGQRRPGGRGDDGWTGADGDLDLGGRGGAHGGGRDLGRPGPGAAGVPEGPEGDSATGGEDLPLEEADAPAGIAELADGSPQEPADASEGGGAGASTTGDADAVEAAEATPVETAPAPMEEAEPTAPEDSRSLPPLEDTSQALARAARRYDAGQYESADALLDRILAQEPGWSEALMLRARVKLDREQYVPALEAARKVTLLSPQVVEAHLIVGVCEESLGHRRPRSRPMSAS